MTQGTRIIVRCGDCAEVGVDADGVTLRNCLDTDEWSYRFVCPRCRRTNVAPTGRLAGLAAVTAGAAVELWRLPRELEERPTGPSLTVLDLFQLRAALQEPDWFETLQDDDESTDK